MLSNISYEKTELSNVRPATSQRWQRVMIKNKVLHSASALVVIDLTPSVTLDVRSVYIF